MKSFFKMGFLASFSLFLLFSIELTVNFVQYKFLPMSGLEPHTACVGGNHSPTILTHFLINKFN